MLGFVAVRHKKPGEGSKVLKKRFLSIINFPIHGEHLRPVIVLKIKHKTTNVTCCNGIGRYRCLYS